MATHKVPLTEDRSLALSLSEGWIESSWEGMKGVFYQKVQAGLFAPNITIASYTIDEEPSLQELRDQLVATYNTALGHKLLGVEKITFLNRPGVRVESVVIAPNGLRVVQTVRAGVLHTNENETIQVEVAGSCTQSQASDYLPEMRSSLRFAKIFEAEEVEVFNPPVADVSQKSIEELQSIAPKRFPSPKRLEALPPLKFK